MARLPLFTAVIVGGAMFAAAFGCAMSAPPDLTPEIDPTLPGVDAAYDPSPAQGGQGLPPKGNPDPDPPPTGATDAGTKPAVLEAGVDSSPPPPPPPSGAAKPAPGEVLITEVMYDTFGTEPASEWIELHNKASSARALTGLTIKDGGGRTHVIKAGVTIAAGAYVVLTRSTAGATAAKVPASVIAYEYGEGLPANAGVQLANGSTGGVSLLNGPVVISHAPYGGWYSQSGGSSVQLHLLDGAQSSTKTSWCLSLNAWATGSEKGTPGAPEDCP